MGLVTGLLGIGGGSGGTNIPPAVLAQIAAGNGDTAQAAYGSQQALEAQKRLLQALQQQGGVGNQTQVYNELQGVVNGTGPNPAQALLANETGRNVANTAALAAGVRGASANPGLIARQVAQAGAGAQQQAVGQGAALQAQQSLGALSAAGQLANQQAAQQIGATGAVTNAAQTEEQLKQQALARFNDAQISNQNSVNAANAGIANTRAGQQGSALSGVGSAIGTGLGLLLADGGDVDPADAAPAPLPTVTVETPPPPTLTTPGPRSTVGRFLSGVGKVASAYSSGYDAAANATKSNGAPTSPISSLLTALKSRAPAVPAPIPLSLPTTGALLPATDSAGQLLAALGGEAPATNVGSKLKQGGKVPGQAKVKGDSYANDTVAAKLSPGEIVIPRSITKSADPAGGAARFVQAVLDKKRKEGKA